MHIGRKPERMENSKGDLNARYGVRKRGKKKHQQQRIDWCVHNAQSSHFMRRLATLHSSINWSITLALGLCQEPSIFAFYFFSVQLFVVSLWISAPDKFYIALHPSTHLRFGFFLFSSVALYRKSDSSIYCGTIVVVWKCISDPKKYFAAWMCM